MKYVIFLAAVGSVIVLPAIVARMFGASIYALAPIAVFQFFAVVAFLVTTPISLWLTIRALRKNEMKRARAFAVGICIPIITSGVFAVVNGSGLEAAMSV